MSTKTKDFLSIGILAGQLRVPVRDVERAADRLGENPAMLLNNVPMFNREQIDRISAALSKQDNSR